jgi:hypothetical protein
MKQPATSPHRSPSRLMRLARVFCLVVAWFLLSVVIPAARRLTGGYSAYSAGSRLPATGDLPARIRDPRYFPPPGTP